MQNKGSKLWEKAKKIIPGGSQLLSKRSEQFLPLNWPSYYSKAKGIEVWGLDGRKYLDMTFMAVGACPLGYADDDVNAAVIDVVKRGSMCTLNAPQEVDLAEKLLEIHPWASMVRYARCGGEAMAVAVRIARAKTGKDKIAFCGYHGWHDWYISANLASDKNLDGHLLPGLNPLGVPRSLIGSALPFRYNRIDDLKEIHNKNKGQLAAIVMEPIRDRPPEPGFIEEIKEITERSGACLIIDEVSAGFRLNTGGAHLLFGIEPDIAVFAKAMSNGYPMAAIIGNKETMSVAEDTFISSTYWTESVGPTAALATIEKYEKFDVPTKLVRVGTEVQSIWQRCAKRSGLEIDVGGIAPLSHFTFAGEKGLESQTLFTQQMLERGFLAGKSFYSSFAHMPHHIKEFELAVGEVFEIIADAIEDGSIEKMLKGPIAHTGFKRLI